MSGKLYVGFKGVMFNPPCVLRKCLLIALLYRNVSTGKDVHGENIQNGCGHHFIWSLAPRYTGDRGVRKEMVGLMFILRS